MSTKCSVFGENILHFEAEVALVLEFRINFKEFFLFLKAEIPVLYSSSSDEKLLLNSESESSRTELCLFLLLIVCYYYYKFYNTLYGL